jgi:hypothetical protein
MKYQDAGARNCSRYADDSAEVMPSSVTHGC